MAVPIPVVMIPPPTPQEVAIAIGFGLLTGIGFTVGWLLRKPITAVAEQLTAGLEWPTAPR